MKTYFYLSPSGDGWRNLALDEWFLDHLQPEERILYLYRNENAVIIGRNQNPWKECDLSAMEADGVQLVRRITGGGAVFHDPGNVNFSFITGEAHYDTDGQFEVIRQAVASFGIPCEHSGRNDLLAEGRKFSGNAFCGRGEMRQHHGTLLIASDLTRLTRYLTVDPRKIRSKGIESVRSRVCNLSEFTPDVTPEAMIRALRASCEAVFGPCEDYVFPEEAAEQGKAYYEKHASREWRLGQTMAFDMELDPRFPWGGVTVQFSVAQGVVTAVQVYTDALDPELPEELTRRLTGCAFEREALCAALAGEDPRLADLREYLRSEPI